MDWEVRGAVVNLSKQASVVEQPRAIVYSCVGGKCSKKDSPSKKMESKSHWDSHTITESYDGYGEENTSKKRILCRFLKAAIFVICVAGFFCQITEYLLYFITHPTVISLEEEKPEVFVTPAFTICNTNPVQRSKYCIRYPNRCEKPQDIKSFCEKGPHYCNKKDMADFKIPKEMYYSPNSTLYQLTKKDIDELGQDNSSFNAYYSRKTDRRVFFDSPHLFKQRPLSCWTRNDRFESDLEPEISTFEESGYTYLGRFKLNVEEDESFDPRVDPRVIFSVHSPFAPLNPHFRGELMKPGNLYQVHIRLEEERFLPHPYQSDCIDYNDLWVKNNRTGPRSHQMCERRCGMNVSMEYYGCIYGVEMYDNLKGICSENVSRAIQNAEIFIQEEEMWQKLRACRRTCKMECEKRKYPYTIIERQDPNLVTDRYGRRFIDIEVFVDGLEIQVMSHKPRYMDVELFSYIGGFIGLWLGLSIWSFTGVVGYAISRIMALCKRESKAENTKRSNRTIFHAPPLPFGTLVVILIAL